MDPRHAAVTFAVVLGLIVTIVLVAYMRSRSAKITAQVAVVAFLGSAIASVAVSLLLQILVPAATVPFGAAYLLAGLLFALASAVAWLFRRFHRGKGG